MPSRRHLERDPDLLLLAHRVLPPVPAALTRLHLARCADCRRRLGELRTASDALAAAVRDPGMPRWSPLARSGASVAALLLVTVLVGTALVTLAMHSLRRTPATAPIVGGSCRPDLPSDHCH